MLTGRERVSFHVVEALVMWLCVCEEEEGEEEEGGNTLFFFCGTPKVRWDMRGGPSEFQHLGHLP